MSLRKRSSSLAAVIGDLVSSRVSADRASVHRRLQDVLARGNAQLAPVVPLWITAGDEYQGCFATVGEALRATLWLRLELLPDVDVRHGVGWGPVAVLQEEPRIEDGPAWWVARSAIEEAENDAERAATRHRRTAYARADEVTGPEPAAVNAALICRDHLVGSAVMGDNRRPLRLLRGALAGRTQAELALEEGVSPSAISQRFRADGLSAVLAADVLLGEVR